MAYSYSYPTVLKSPAISGLWKCKCHNRRYVKFFLFLMEPIKLCSLFFMMFMVSLVKYSDLKSGGYCLPHVLLRRWSVPERDHEVVKPVSLVTLLPPHLLPALQLRGFATAWICSLFVSCRPYGHISDKPQTGHDRRWSSSTSCNSYVSILSDASYAPGNAYFILVKIRNWPP